MPVRSRSQRLGHLSNARARLRVSICTRKGGSMHRRRLNYLPRLSNACFQIRMVVSVPINSEANVACPICTRDGGSMHRRHIGDPLRLSSACLQIRLVVSVPINSEANIARRTCTRKGGSMHRRRLSYLPRIGVAWASVAWVVVACRCWRQARGYLHAARDRHSREQLGAFQPAQRFKCMCVFFSADVKVSTLACEHCAFGLVLAAQPRDFAERCFHLVERELGLSE
jgi:hypothetical protein